MDLFEYEGAQGAEQAAHNAPEFTVSELSGAVKKSIESGFSHVRVRAEVGRVSRPRSGHIYLDLKDDRSVLASVIWKGRAQGLATPPEEGMEVIATGKLTTFPGQSKYQMVIEDIAPAGVGALMAMLEKRKAMLKEEGLFAAERKRPLPYLPEIIGVVTSPSGAVIRDILHRLRDRFPRKVLVWPVAVQGQKSADEVVRAIEGFNAFTPGGALPRPDVLIVARGGGSLEDLWGFNEERVARAAAASGIPLISAVGHETDTTLIDFVSDQRAPTPSAAAELAVPVRLDLLSWVREQDGRLSRILTTQMQQKRQRLSDIARVLPRADSLLDTPIQRLDVASGKLPQALRAMTLKKRHDLATHSGALRPSVLVRHIVGERRRIADKTTRLPALLERYVAQQKTYCARQTLKVPNLQSHHERLQTLDARLSAAQSQRLKERKVQLAGLERLYETLGYKETLRRGYAVVRVNGQVTTSTQALQQAGEVNIEVADGSATLRVGAKEA